ncbi:MAG: hypothetical protein AUK51_02210 [Comamonadaceae bacterium CG2_30_59_20]|nr:MAG: hypothetical protein AUK51_02210 [Comamonadaceae bacterium CG2_30_59_20]
MRAVTQRQPSQTLIPVTVIECLIEHIDRRHRHWCPQQLATQVNLDLAITVGQKAITSDTLEPRWQNVQQESANELVGIQAHGLVL